MIGVHRGVIQHATKALVDSRLLRATARCSRCLRRSCPCTGTAEPTREDAYLVNFVQESIVANAHFFERDIRYQYHYGYALNDKLKDELSQQEDKDQITHILQPRDEQLSRWEEVPHEVFEPGDYFESDHACDSNLSACLPDDVYVVLRDDKNMLFACGAAPELFVIEKRLQEALPVWQRLGGCACRGRASSRSRRIGTPDLSIPSETPVRQADRSGNGPFKKSAAHVRGGASCTGRLPFCCASCVFSPPRTCAGVGTRILQEPA